MKNIKPAGRYVNPLTDFGFKKLFGTELNKEIMIEFLNVLLPQHHHVEDISYKVTEDLPDETACRI
ncbi:MAG: PD-(D/E)XK nuclease family transposase [Bacteroidales bacterium]